MSDILQRRPINPATPAEPAIDLSNIKIDPQDLAATPAPTPTTAPEAIPTPAPAESNEPTTDAEWEAKINAAKANEANPQVTLSSEPAATVTVVEPTPKTESTPESKSTIDIEAEIEHRVRERMAQLQAAASKAEPQPATTTESKSTSEEELAAKHAEIAKTNNASNIIFINLGSDEDVTNALKRDDDEDARPQELRTEPTQYRDRVEIASSPLGQRNDQQRLLTTWIRDLLKDHPDALKAVEDKLRVNKITKRIGDGTGPKRLSGAAAKAAVISRVKGMYRIQLYNSGFWIECCPPSMMDIDVWMKEVDQEFKELGRVMGGYAYAVMDVLLKRKLCDILPGLIQRSNFVDYNNKRELLSNISYHDYDTILWGICCMMYRDGIGIGVNCTNPDCRHIDTSQYLDLGRLCYLNTEKFPSAALEWVTTHAQSTADSLSAEDLRHYRNDLLGFTRTVKVDKNDSTYELEVPNILEFVERGAALVGKLTALTNGDKSIQSDSMTNQLTFHIFKMLLPWIKSLSMNDPDGNLMYRIEDKDAIYESLDITAFDNQHFYDEVVEFIRDTKLSYFAANTLKCPKCGKIAELDKDNLTPLDMQYLFFGLCCLLMIKNGNSF